MPPSIAAIQTNRLILEPISEEHLTDRYVGWLNDKIITAHSEQRHKTHTLKSCRQFAESMQTAGHYFWAIVATDNPSLGHIGNLSAYIDAANDIADLTILIGEQASWGHGYGSEAWIAACEWLFDEAGMRKITAGTMATNVAMISIMKKAGMVEEGRKKKQFLQDGKEVDAVYAALFKSV